MVGEIFSRGAISHATGLQKIVSFSEEFTNSRDYEIKCKGGPKITDKIGTLKYSVKLDKMADILGSDWPKLTQNKLSLTKHC